VGNFLEDFGVQRRVKSQQRSGSWPLAVHVDVLLHAAVDCVSVRHFLPQSTRKFN
jgi:hypothetical protein